LPASSRPGSLWSRSSCRTCHSSAGAWPVRAPLAAPQPVGAEASSASRSLSIRHAGPSRAGSPSSTRVVETVGADWLETVAT
jgi:hypothetical protein